MMLGRLLLALGAFLAATAAHAADLTVTVKDPNGRPVADAVVTVDAPGRAPAPGRFTISQRDMKFVPEVLVVPVGSTIGFGNLDPFRHHVYSFSPAKTFEIKLYSGRSPESILFDKPGVITIGCNIHDWMIAYVLVVPTPYFAPVNSAGNALLRDLRPGAYEVHAWHPRQKAAPAPVALSLEGAASSLGAAFNVEVEPRKPRYKPPLDRLRY